MASAGSCEVLYGRGGFATAASTHSITALRRVERSEDLLTLLRRVLTQTQMRTVLTTILHTAFVVVALFIFVLGLGIGLALNPALGTLLWVVAGVTAVGNTVWIVMRFRRRSGQGHTR